MPEDARDVLQPVAVRGEAAVCPVIAGRTRFMPLTLEPLPIYPVHIERRLLGETSEHAGSVPELLQRGLTGRVGSMAKSG
jgi:hypothetical protein